MNRKDKTEIDRKLDTIDRKLDTWGKAVDLFDKVVNGAIERKDTVRKIAKVAKKKKL